MCPMNFYIIIHCYACIATYCTITSLYLVLWSICCWSSTQTSHQNWQFRMCVATYGYINNYTQSCDLTMVSLCKTCTCTCFYEVSTMLYVAIWIFRAKIRSAAASILPCIPLWSLLPSLPHAQSLYLMPSLLLNLLIIFIATFLEYCYLALWPVHVCISLFIVFMTGHYCTIVSVKGRKRTLVHEL